jgi:hypothetical protein
MKKCPHCGIISDHHTIGGVYCLRTRLGRSEKMCKILVHALGEIRLETLLDDDLSDASRNASLEYIDAALNGEPL